MPDGQANAAAREAQLPNWNLSDLYPGPDSPELAADLTRAVALRHPPGMGRGESAGGGLGAGEIGGKLWTVGPGIEVGEVPVR